MIGGFAYWEGRVFEKQSGGAKGAGRGELAALHGGIECLAGNAKGAGGLRGAAVAFDKSGNGFINHGGVQAGAAARGGFWRGYRLSVANKSYLSICSWQIEQGPISFFYASGRGLIMFVISKNHAVRRGR